MTSPLRPSAPRHLLAPLALAALLAAGCNPLYSPPARLAHYGAPGRVHEGTVELGISGFFSPAMAGAVHGGYGFTDWVALEGGGSAGAYAGSSSQRQTGVVGWLGPRFSLPRHYEKKAQFIGDIELGLGGGFGGSKQQAAFGGYQGLSAGLGISWFSLYLRGRVEESTSAGVPTTWWPSGLLGLGFEAGREASLDLGFGAVGYVNTRDQAWSPFGQLDITWRYDARKGR